MTDASPDRDRLLETLLRNLQEFEERIQGIEERCRHIRRGLRSLGDELGRARDAFRASCAAGLEAAVPDVEIPLSRLVELSGMVAHVEPETGSGMIIHAPGGVSIPVDGQVRPGPGLAEEVRERIQQLAANPRGGARPGGMAVVYVPVETSGPMPDPAAGAAGERIVAASPSALLLILRCVASRWLSLACARDARALVDSGQDLVGDFSSFIADFTDSENDLCAIVDGFAAAASPAAPGSDLPAPGNAPAARHLAPLRDRR